jgi:hypothetical protein
VSGAVISTRRTIDRSKRNSPVELHVARFRTITPVSIEVLLKEAPQTVWIPRSQIHPSNALSLDLKGWQDRSGVLTVNRWWAEARGLVRP